MAVGVAVGVGGALGFRRWQLRWGALDDEVAMALPGDAIITAPDVVATRAIQIAAPPAVVWPWIAQMGQGRGGLYSYDVLENLVGCDMRSAAQVVPEWQDVGVGDPFRLHPEVALEVAAVDAGRALVVRGGVPMGEQAPPYDFTWAFVVVARPDGGSRLVVRERYRYTRGWAPLLVEPIQVVSFVMSQKMLRGIKRRAEARRETSALIGAAEA